MYDNSSDRKFTGARSIRAASLTGVLASILILGSGCGVRVSTKAAPAGGGNATPASVEELSSDVSGARSELAEIRKDLAEISAAGVQGASFSADKIDEILQAVESAESRLRRVDERLEKMEK